MSSDFKKLLSARFFFTFAVEMQGVLLGWRMYELTHDKFCLAMIGLAEAIPAIGLALYAGYLVDRNRPLGIFRWVLVGSWVSGLILFLSQVAAVGLAPREQVWALYAASVVTGAARAFSQPSMYAILPRLVGREHLPLQTARMSTVMQFARVSGPSAGGYLLHFTGMTASAGFVCVMLMAAFSCAWLIEARIEAASAASGSESKLKELLSGASFVFRHPILFPALSLDMISVLFGGVTGLLPVYAQDILHVGSDGLGNLKTAAAIGAALMSLSLSRRGIGKSAGKLLLGAVAGFGACMIVFGVSTNYYLSLAALGLGGAFDSISVIIRSTAVQLASPDTLRGKISAVNSIFIGSSNEIGEFESNIAAQYLGTVPSVLAGGTICILTVVVAAVLFPALRKLDLSKMADRLRA